MNEETDQDRATGPIKLTANRLCVFTGDKQILSNVRAVARSGSLLAVMGPSGCGKTTFMNALSGRVPLASGAITVGDKPVTARLAKTFGYVTQVDVFFPVLTLRQTMEFAARVTLPNAATEEARRARIDEVISWLELEKCMNTIMGNSGMPGLSGGEKKRASIACELLRNPDVLLLDEPTSGLDSSLAMALVDLLSKWSKQGNKIVAASIHQPSSQIFHIFDDLLLLTDGQVSYSGKCSSMIQYFDSIGVPFQQHWNPADFMLEIVKSSASSKRYIIEQGAKYSDLEKCTGELDMMSSSKVSQANQIEEMSDRTSGDSMPTDSSDVNWGRQLAALTVRGFQLSRNRFLSMFSILQTLFVGVLCSLLWLRISRTEEHIWDILGCVFFLTWNLSYPPVLQAIASVHEDLIIVKHEQRAGMYKIGAYYVAKTVSEIPLTIAMPLISLTLIYWTARLGSATEFAPFVLGILVNNLTFQGIGIFIALLTDAPQANVTIAYTLMMFSGLLSGYLRTNYPVWLEWAKYLSFNRYCYHYCMQLVILSSQHFTCSSTLISIYPSCRNRTYLSTNNLSLVPSTEILEHFSDQPLPIWSNLLIILLLLVLFRVAGYLRLRYSRKL